MTGPTDEDSAERTETALRSLSRRALLGLVVALWSTGSLSDVQATRLLYGTQGFGRFGYGGTAAEGKEEGN